MMELIEKFINDEQLDWGKLGSVCTDGAPSMLSVRSGFVELVKRKNPNIIATHCIIHREALASRAMPPPLKQQPLDCSIKIVNYVKSSALNTRLFQKLCQDMESQYDSLLFHTFVRWLSKGTMLTRLVHLLPEVVVFLDARQKKILRQKFPTSCF